MKREELGIKIKILRCRFSARVRANGARQGRWPGFHVPSGARTGPGNPAPVLISPQYGAPPKGNEKREELRTLRVVKTAASISKPSPTALKRTSSEEVGWRQEITLDQNSEPKSSLRVEFIAAGRCL